jgi:hypothetical protein
MTQTYTQIKTREANILNLLRKYDPAGVGVYPEFEKDFVEYAYEALYLSTVPNDSAFISIACNLLQATYGRVVDAYMTKQVSLVAAELQKM